ncbi:MAG: hypothetical protein FWH36_01185 [Lentimicrobiaceae bacterium]|nr:hypothetical protein [Lentimicrobiaceae bacterium]
MEMYKNRNDKPYLLLIAVLTMMMLLLTFWSISLEKSGFAGDSQYETGYAIYWLLLVFTVLGLAVFSLLYPFRLLNTDYKNRVMSLIFASGVSREKYYLVKISATILTCFMATLAILFIPAVTFLLVYPEVFVEMMQQFIENFTLSNIVPFVLRVIFSLLAYFVTLTTAVIITKGRVSGIFLFIGFLFAVSFVQTMFTMPLLLSFEYNVNFNLNVSTVSSIIQIIVFALIGLAVLRKQDL